MSERDKAIRDRLRRTEGQLRGVLRMLDEGRSCEEIVTQLLAVRAAVDRAAVEVVLAHADECLATFPPEQARAAIGRAVRLLGRVS
ncbi:MAG: metal-sensing transcriptional repressor [Chloroflexi bacterium]|nr:metal-sensing transcriptional repressor [Chloroflexota bacterium]